MKVRSDSKRCRTAALAVMSRLETARAATPSSQTTLVQPHCRMSGRGSEGVAERGRSLLPVGYFHVVYTLPAAL